MTEASSFHVQCCGQIESGDFGQIDNLYCRYAFHFGQDWTVSAVRRAAVESLFELLYGF